MLEQEPSEAAGLRRARRVAGWAGLGFFLLQLGWVLVMPPSSGIDEFDHVYRASAVSMGHWQPGEERLGREVARGGLLPVRSDLVEASSAACARLPYTPTFNCRPFRDLHGDIVEVASAADAYNPTFYAVVGTIARPFRGQAAIYTMRAIAAGLCAATFTWAVFLTARWSRTRWPMAALLLAALPTTIYSTSIVAPNGLHMMSGLLVWTAIVAILTDVRPSLRRASYAALCWGVAVLANTHTMGLLWIGLIGLTVLADVGPRRAWSVFRPRTRLEKAAAALGVGATVLAMLWLWYAEPNMSGQHEGALHGNPWGNIALSVPLWLLQAIGAFPLRNEPAPTLLYAVAILALVALALATSWALRGEKSLRRAVVVLLVLSVAVPVALTYLTYQTTGLAWQGRYGMPYSVGLFVLAAVALDRRLGSPRLSFLVVGAGAWAFAHVVGQLGVLDQQRADHRLIALTGWSPPSPVLIGALGLLAAVAWAGSLRAAGPVPPAVHRT